MAISINWYRRARLQRTVKAWEELALDTTPQDEVDRKLRQLAGIGAAYCGHANYGEAEPAIKCALSQFSKKEPFYVRISTTGIDNWGSTAFAGDSDGKPYYVKYTSSGVPLDQPRADAQFFDHRFGVVIPCPLPTNLRAYTPESSVLILLDPPPDPWWIRWPSKIIESTRQAVKKTDTGSLLTCFPMKQEP